MPKKPRLSVEDWLAAGFRALATSGPAALRAEALARELKASKGSFYWHFKDLPDFKAQMLMLWREKVATEIMADVGTKPSPSEMLEHLVARAAQPAPEAFGGKAIEPAVRAWSLTDPDVAEALAEVDRIRTQFLAEVLKANGVSDPHLPQVVYAAYLGLDDLSAKGRGDLATGLSTLVGLITRTPGSKT